MSKQTLVACIILSCSSTMANADGAFYLGGGLDRTFSYNQTFLNLFGGYGTTLGKNNRFYLGTELSSLVNLNHVSYTAPNLGLSILPGIYLSQSTLLYGRLGIEAFRRNIDVYVYDQQHYSYKKYDYGLQYGLGLQTSLTKSLDLRTEVSPTNRFGHVNLSLLYKFN